jgi:regulator of sigma E protease
MSHIIISLVAFVVALGILITGHEFGHFWVARRMGVKVLRFSIGFGYPLAHWYGKDGVEYQVALLPLGGYVKMLDEREGEVDPQERHLAFNQQSVFKRFAIVLAGPMANFILAIAFYWAVLVLGVPGVKPLLGDIKPSTPAAAAGLHKGDEITTVQGSSTPTWEQVDLRLIEASLGHDEINLTVKRNGKMQAVDLNLGSARSFDKPEQLADSLGLSRYSPVIEPIIGEIEANGAAAKAGLRPGDRLLSLDGKEIQDWSAWVDAIRKQPNRPLNLMIERQGERHQLTLITQARDSEQGPVGYIGAAPRVPSSLREQLTAEYKYPLLPALPAAVAKTWDMSVMTLQMLGKMVVGQIGLKNLSGPINIAHFAGQSAGLGLVPFLGFLAVVSISLGVLNLLPIPVLDGGHLFYYLVEMIKGTPVSERIQILGQQFGMAVLLMMMGLAFYNDIARLLG